jgi:hypothetical protein
MNTKEIKMKQLNGLPSVFLAAALLGAAVFPAMGQTPEIRHDVREIPANSPNTKPVFEPHFYHLIFVVKELEAGKVINSRTYFMSIGTVEGSSNTFSPRSIRTGTKVPVEAEAGKVNYVDIGVNIDCRSVLDLGSRMAMDLSAEISSVQKDVEDRNKVSMVGQGPTPLIQQNKWNSQIVVPFGKPTVVFSSDEVASKRTIELELTATEIK